MHPRIELMQPIDGVTQGKFYRWVCAGCGQQGTGRFITPAGMPARWTTPGERLSDTEHAAAVHAKDCEHCEVGANR